MQEEETREERERVRDVADWAAENREDEDAVGEEGESTIGSLGVFLNGTHGGRERLSRSKSSSSARGESIF